MPGAGMRTAILDAARRKHLHAATWTHPTKGPIVSVARSAAVPPDRFRDQMRAIIQATGGTGLRFHYAGKRHVVAKRLGANPPAPRQLVRLGDVIELRLAGGTVHRWKRGDRAMLVSPGAEKESAGYGRITIADVRASKAAPRGPHKTAEHTHETWHGQLPRGARVANIPGPDEFTRTAGRVAAIVYYSTKWHGRASYIHDFDKSATPLLLAGPRGAYQIRGGKFRITARGIVG